jgi:hypothetical protein
VGIPGRRLVNRSAVNLTNSRRSEIGKESKPGKN